MKQNTAPKDISNANLVVDLPHPQRSCPAPLGGGEGEVGKVATDSEEDTFSKWVASSSLSSESKYESAT